MRVLLVANWDLDADPTPWATQRVSALRRAGIEADVLAVPCHGELGGYFRLWRALSQKLETGAYDLVAPLYGSVLGLLCAAQRRTPCAVSFAGSDLNGPLARHFLDPHRLSGLLSQLAAALSRGVSVRNPEMRQALWWPPARRRAWVIGSGVDTRRFRPHDRADARRLRGLPVDGARVIVVANRAADRPGKRISLARAAVARLRDVTLEVVDQLPFDEMPLAYASADALLLTSAREGSPNCVKEALACGVPVVSVDVGDVREVLAGLRNCPIVAARPEALAAALAGVISDGGGCPEGPERMAARCSLEAMAGEFVRFYLTLGPAPAIQRRLQRRSRRTSYASA
jgi:teichuronic acid biosynthesis glycosyltransferase TuaC